MTQPPSSDDDGVEKLGKNNHDVVVHSKEQCSSATPTSESSESRLSSVLSPQTPSDSGADSTPPGLHQTTMLRNPHYGAASHHTPWPGGERGGSGGNAGPSFQSPTSPQFVGTPFTELRDGQLPFEYPFPSVSYDSSSSSSSTTTTAATSPSSSILRSLGNGSSPSSSSYLSATSATQAGSHGFVSPSLMQYFQLSKSSSELPDLLYHSPPVVPPKRSVSDRPPSSKWSLSSWPNGGGDGGGGRRTTSTSLIHPSLRLEEPPIPPSLREKLKKRRWHSVDVSRGEPAAGLEHPPMPSTVAAVSSSRNSGRVPPRPDDALGNAGDNDDGQDSDDEQQTFADPNSEST